MLSDIISGNAVTDGKEFHCWIVGRIEKWCGQNNIPFDRGKYGLRNAQHTEVKWGVYKKGEVRSGWASRSEMIGMSILIRGDSTFFFRDEKDKNEIKEVRMKSEGDYVIWREDVEHTWKMSEDSVFVTLRWMPDVDL